MAVKIVAGPKGWQTDHLERYLETDGAEGHFVDFSGSGGLAETPCLILETTGRQSGEQKLAPLIYGEDAGRYVIVASKGGAPHHPAWFLNIEASPAVKFQVAEKKYEGTAVIADTAERKRLYAMMAAVYPPYIDYQAKTEREIPVVLLAPNSEIDRL